jgi:hypothetical protein
MSLAPYNQKFFVPGAKEAKHRPTGADREIQGDVDDSIFGLVLATI